MIDGQTQAEPLELLNYFSSFIRRFNSFDPHFANRLMRDIFTQIEAAYFRQPHAKFIGGCQQVFAEV